MDITELLDPFTRLLEDVSSPAAIRAIEGGGSADALWEAIAGSGFLDALVPEACGGAGLSFTDVALLLMALGRHAVPVPVAETMVARALLAAAGVAVPDGPIVLATAEGQRTAAVPLARVASHALIDTGNACVLTPLSVQGMTPTGVALSLAASLSWGEALEGVSLAGPSGGLRLIAGVVRACAIAGAAERVAEMTVNYANERVQFGKPIGKQQALQQNMAVMAEQVIACRLAAQSAAAGGFPPSLLLAAMAKQVTSAAAPIIANTAHAVHGAIGISAEYDLHLLTRRLHEWRLADGSESYWAQRLGQDRLASPLSTVDYIRERLVA